jgi:hypothetical protein
MDDRLRRVAARQHGLFTRQEALAPGLSQTKLRRQVRLGARDVPARGVYGVPGWPGTWRRRLMLATLDIGPCAVVSHPAAAASLA